MKNISKPIRKPIRCGNNNHISGIISSLELLIGDPSRGLPLEAFLFISKVTPVINVDLLIKNNCNHTLLAWRDDGYYPASWHIPGGVVRYKETLSDRIKAVAANELGTRVKFERTPLAINEVIHPTRRVRGHFISLLYKCTLLEPPDKNIEYEKGNPSPGEWAWHKKCPNNIIPVHRMYKKFI